MQSYNLTVGSLLANFNYYCCCFDKTLVSYLLVTTTFNIFYHSYFTFRAIAIASDENICIFASLPKDLIPIQGI